VLALAAKGTIKGILGVTAAGLAHIGPVPYSNTDFRRNAANTVIYYGSRSSPLTTTQIWGSGTAHVLYLATIRDLILKIKARSWLIWVLTLSQTIQHSVNNPKTGQKRYVYQLLSSISDVSESSAFLSSSVTGRLETTSSIKPKDFASSAVMKLSRSTAFSIVSRSCPVWST